MNNVTQYNYFRKILTNSHNKQIKKYTARICVRRDVLHAGHLYLASRGDVDGGRARHSGADPVAACLLHPDARPVHLLSPGADRARAQQGPDTRRGPRRLRHRSQ